MSIAPTISRRDDIQAWIQGFLWEFYDSGMSNEEAAETILATLENCLPFSERTRSIPLEHPRALFQAWKKRADQT
jgi:hypothetical protein